MCPAWTSSFCSFVWALIRWDVLRERMYELCDADIDGFAVFFQTDPLGIFDIFMRFGLYLYVYED